MSYTKLNLTNGTLIDESVFKHIEDGITDNIPTIGENGNWYLGDSDTGKPSRGETGKSAYTYAKEGGFIGSETEFAKSLSEALIVNISGNDNDGYTADRTFSEIKTAILAGQTVYAFIDSNGLYPLLYGTGSYETFDNVTFGFIGTAFIEDEFQSFFTIIDIGEDGEVSLIEDNSSIQALRNPKVMSINGISYDGSSAINFTDTINAMIDVKVGVLENGTY